ncbi:FN3 domain-containing metallophosphoesterase family protein [Pedobacter insulae]|uniref:Purple acid Phosphatase, N-terminal domain n=1 Tax=Pedobacter insulae TaxID=414048 RepID=A0A1I2WKV4_9SPHI|nr:FN3 domain-containing metallophosphoesterase family protein [Pedobacter insulae]SFH00211.1 Purple acid Phosphatase, N-terminal domain [Pedobacter insulae]
MDNKISANRRSFLKGGLALGGLSLLNPISAVANPVVLEEEEFSIKVGPYLQTDFNGSIAVLWITNKNCNSWVEYGETPEQMPKKAYGEGELGLLPAGRLNCVKLPDLKPDCKYYYRIVSREIVSFQPYKVTYGKTIQGAIEHFVNADLKKEEVSFVMLNDIHDRPNSIPELLSLDKGNKRDFVFFNGDIFDYQTNEQQIIDHMLEPCVSAFAKTTPFLYVRGNHETRGVFARDFKTYFHHVAYTAFTLGPVRFIVLDTGEDKEDSHPVYAELVDFDHYRVKQAAWLAQEIDRKEFKKAAFRIVLMHIPPRYSGDGHGAKHCTALFEPIMNRGKVDLVLSGHTHKYKVHPPAKGQNNYPIIIGGGPLKGTKTLTKVLATKTELKVVMLNDSGTEVADYVIATR